MKMRNLLYLSLIMLTLSCATDSVDPLNTQLKQLQSIELHYPWGQVESDSLFYTDSRLSSHINRSTNRIDVITYSFEYNPSSLLMFHEQNGTRSVDFVRKDTFSTDQRLIQRIVKIPDGSLFSTYDFIYDADEKLVAQQVTGSDYNYIDSIQLDSRGNQISVNRINDNSMLITEYDHNPNPFYQQPLNISTFRTDSPNNLTRFQIIYADTLFYEKTYQYQYGPDNYPIQVVVQGSFSGDVEETYYLYY